MIRILAAALALAPAAFAETAPVDVSLLKGWRTDDGRQVAAIRIDLEPGWKTYWRQPGEAGIPPEFDWTGSANIARADWHWPSPVVFEQNGISAVGYSGDVILPVVLTPQVEGEPIDISLGVQIGICQSICILYDTDVAGTLDGTEAQAGNPIAPAMSDRPMTPAEAGIGAVTCQIAPADRGVTLTTRIGLPTPLGRKERVAVEIPGSDIRIAYTDTDRDGGELLSATALIPPRGSPLALDRSAIRFTILSDGGAAEVMGCD